MKYTLIFALLLCLQANALERTETVLVRKYKSYKPIFEQKVLEDLTSDNCFEGKYFKIVEGQSDKAICNDEIDKNLVLKAATVYFHLTKARNFWINSINSPRAINQKQMTIRLEITNQFNQYDLFSNSENDPQFNNALSIAAGESPDFDFIVNKRKWNDEIWFRPVKKINAKDLPNSFGENPLSSQLNDLKRPITNFTINNFMQTTLEHMFYPLYVTEPYWQTVIRTAGTLALTYGILEGSKHLDSLFIEKYYYMDTAMIPEAIYHEYSHIMLADHLEMTHSTPVNEGLADYFAALIADAPKLLNKIKKYSTSKIKDAKNKSIYSHYMEMNQNAQADFVLSVLWKVKLTLPEVADKLVYNSREMLDTSTSTIQHDLLKSLLETCDKVCSSPYRDRIKLHRAFEEKGL
jgi:hypothetical protein